jgi:hypothetical protein
VAALRRQLPPSGLHRIANLPGHALAIDSAGTVFEIERTGSTGSGDRQRPPT